MKTAELVSRKYRLLGLLAEGGMGEVWSARNERTNREVAVKFLRPELARNPEALRRFVREAKATGQLHHPNIVSAIDAGMHDGRPYRVMELLSGESLAARLERETRLDPIEACIVLAQVARALAHAHQAGVIHRDLCAANVFLSVSPEGPPVVKVLDFGVSKVIGDVSPSHVRTAIGMVLGSPGTMSPEQIEGAEDPDGASDLWSLGVLAYQCISGRMPFSGPNHNALMQAIVHQAHVPLVSVVPEADAALVELVESCLVKDRTLRLGSARELARHLEGVALRLSRLDKAGRYVPLRRVVDRARATESNWRFRRALPTKVLPLGVRAIRAVCRLPPAVLLTAGLAGGGAVTVGVMALLSPAAEDSTIYSVGSVCEVPAGSKGDAAKTAKPGNLTPAAAAAASETDLVRAVARSLDVAMVTVSDPQPERLVSFAPVTIQASH